MKTQIKQFLFTFFYFNTNERKGLISLCVLVIFLQILSFTLKQFVYSQDIPELSIAQLNWIQDTLISDIDYRQSAGFFNKKFQHGNKNRFTYVADSVHLTKKRLIKYPIDINSADSITLVALPKIGPFLAGRIVDYRTKLGGFHSLDQLTEIWSFKEDYLYDLTGKIWIDPGKFNYLNINELTFDELKTHPYFKYSLSKAIVNNRTHHGKFNNIQDLKRIKMVNDSIIELISPYIRFD